MDIPRRVGLWLLAVGGCLLPPGVAAQNLLVNPHFSGDLTGWQATPGTSQTTYDATRSATADGTGSVGTIVNVDGFPGFADAFTPSQCVSGIVAGANYSFGGAVLAPSGQAGGSGRGSLQLGWFASSDCSGDQVSLGTAETPLRGPAAGDPADTWLAAQANAVAPSGANSVLFAMHGWSISGRYSNYQINFDDVFLVQAPAPPPQPNGLCSVDPTCSAGGQQRARDSGSGSCVALSTCSELWMCPQGPVNRSCGANGVQDCAFSADCGEAVADCFQGICRALGSCNDRVKFHGYAQTPDANQCSCAGNPPAAGGACGSPPSSACTADGLTACLDGGRFKVQASFDAGSMGAGAAHLASLSGDTAYLWFFSSSNAEAMLKVLDGCGVNGHYWVFVGGLTNVAVTITVTDTASHTQENYQNPAGTPFAPIQDTAAFAACP